MMEEEFTSIIQFVLAETGITQSYRYQLPEDYTVPCAFFPIVETEYSGSSLDSYQASYKWEIVFYDRDVTSAFAKAEKTAAFILDKRRVIPVQSVDGQATEKGIRLRDFCIKEKEKEKNALQLMLAWDSTYRYEKADVPKMQRFEVEKKKK